MREILFRGKRLDNGEWVEGFYAVASGNRHLILEDGYREGFDYNGIADSDYWDVDPATVGQFTGLHDMVGSRVFEGDIVRAYTQSWAFADHVFVVKYGDRSFYMSNPSGETDQQKNWYMNFRVIGNIHDNPELLAEEAKQDG